MMLGGVHQTSFGHKKYFVPTTWNPLDKASEVSLSNGNLTATCSTGDKGARGVLGIDLDSGATAYCEFTIDTVGSSGCGVARATAPLTGSNPQGHADSWLYNAGTGFWENTGGDTNTGVSFSPGDVMMLAVSGANIWWGRNGAWSLSGAPSTNTNPAFSNLSGIVHPVFVQSGGTASTITANFGQQSFSYSPPSGFTAGWGAS